MLIPFNFIQNNILNKIFIVSKNMLRNLLKVVFRKKKLNGNVLDTELKRCFSLFDLTMLGLGGMIGSGIFVVTGTLTKDTAGPAIILSYLIAGFAAFLSALCYAELGALFPKAGSAYSYTYVIMGEMIAFLIGWNMVLELIIGTAAVAKASSGSFDSLLNGAISNFTMEHIGKFNLPYFTKSPDIAAAFVLLIWSIVLALGANISSFFTAVFGMINLSLLSVIVGFGVYLCDFKLWNEAGMQTFAPYGFSGVVTASAACFYSYSGFETITTAAEESKNPRKHVPLALTISITLVTLIYIAVSGSLSLLVPLDFIDTIAPFPTALKYNKFMITGQFISIGTIIGLSASLISSLYSFPRILYAIASDGLLFSQLSYVNSKTNTPLISIGCVALATSCVALVVSLETLVELLSIGTLLSFIFVAANLILLRYKPEDNFSKPSDSNAALLTSSKEPNTLDENLENNENESTSSSSNKHKIGALKSYFSNCYGIKNLSKESTGPIGIVGILFSSSGIFLLFLNAKSSLLQGVWWAIVIMNIFVICFLWFVLFLFMHHHKTTSDTFQVCFGIISYNNLNNSLLKNTYL